MSDGMPCFFSLRRAAAALLVALSAGACTHGASMQIEVEVYKGPLSKTVAVQEEELCAKITDAERTFGHLYATLANVIPVGLAAEQKDARPRRDACLVNSDSSAHQESEDNKERERNARECNPKNLGAGQNLLLMADICWAENSATEVLNKWTPTEVSTPPDYPDKATIESGKGRGAKRQNYVQAARLGAQYRDRANFWASTQAAHPEKDDVRRIEINEFAQFLAETGNQLVSRADALLMQDERLNELYKEYFAADEGVVHLSAAQRLATSIFLRDSNTTAFQNLYDWNRRVGLDLDAGVGGLDELDRVRMIEELMRDNHWSKINTVQANGIGETRMAFIKDDIGNWNLKSFSSDPEELLKAYSNLTRGVLNEAIQAATTGGAGNAVNKVARSEALSSFASRALAGKSSAAEPTIGPANLRQLRKRIRERLAAEHEQMTAATSGKKTELGTAQASLKTQSDMRNAAENYISAHRADCDAAESPAPGDPPIEEDEAAETDDETELEGGADEACEALKAEIAKRDTAAAEVARLEAEAAALQSEIASIEKASIDRARVILRDHAIVVGTLQEVISASDGKEEGSAIPPVEDASNP